jgi:glycosyltransferase involved in cell wall biosynthesis
VTISAIIITKNEAGSIRRCLESVAWVDEIVVLDSGSDDQTVAICRQFGAKVETTADWPGFGTQKNRALERATGEWVLSLDADESVSRELQAEIRATIAKPGGKQAFKLPRSSLYCSRYMRHSGWWPDYVVRLFKRGSGRFSDDLVHERFIADGSVGTLVNPLMHETYADLEEVLRKVNDYSSAGAAMMQAKGIRSSLLKAILHGFWTFVRTYVIRAGFLDGREGFMLAVSNAEGTYYRYLKLMLLAQKR